MSPQLGALNFRKENVNYEIVEGYKNLWHPKMYLYMKDSSKWTAWLSNKQRSAKKTVVT